MRYERKNAVRRRWYPDWPNSLAPLAVAGLLVIALAGTVAQAHTVVVKMTNSLKFVPAHVTISVGDAVEWKNVSDLVHTATDVPKKAVNTKDASLPSGAKPFNSGYLKPGQTYRHVFHIAGVYHYFCIPHEPLGMVGTVTVKSR